MYQPMLGVGSRKFLGCLFIHPAGFDPAVSKSTLMNAKPATDSLFGVSNDVVANPCGCVTNNHIW